MSSTKIKTQVLILGSGPGGYSAAFHCSDLGINTIIVERYSNLGGVCLNVGCIPSKALLHISKLIKANNNLNKYSIINTKKNNIELDIGKIRLWKNNIINRLSKNLHSITKTRNIEIIRGSGKFINSHTVQVSINHTIITEITFDYVIIATGSYPISLSFLPNDQRIWNSTHALSLQSIPKTLLIVGSGSIGLEMATVYHDLGTKVDLVETCTQIMPTLDHDIMHIFYKHFHKNNIDCIINTTVHSVSVENTGVYVTMENNQDSNKKITKLYDSILIAIGRSPNSTTLNLEHIGVNINQYGFIIVDKQMRTNISHIFAIGDVVGNPMLAHKSMHEGYIASEVISGKKYYFDSKVIPSIVYTDPEIAWVGYTEKQAQEKNISYDTVSVPWTTLGKAIISNDSAGVTKLIFDKKSNRIIGGLILGAHASEIIGEIALAIEMGCDVEDLKLTIHAHPTLYESIQSAASMYHKSINNLFNL